MAPTILNTCGKTHLEVTLLVPPNPPKSDSWGVLGTTFLQIQKSTKNLHEKAAKGRLKELQRAPQITENHIKTNKNIH